LTQYALLTAMSAFLTANAGTNPSPAEQYDVVVYGGTAAGVIAAVQVANSGKSVAIVESGRHVGGLTSGGLGATDIGNKAAIGGLSRQFYRRIGEHYARDESWKYQPREAYKSRRQRGDPEMWTFEPHVAEQILLQMLAEASVPVFYAEPLDLDNGVAKQGAAIRSIHMESGRTFRARVFIDATYEGDLMAGAGVSYHVGREANEVYGETLNGVQFGNAIHHQFTVPVDPYVTPGDPSSGLLPGVQLDDPRPDGRGDSRVQAYCFRICTTDVPENRLAWTKPADYDPLRYELLLRNFEAGDHRVPWNPVLMPNRKTDTNNNYAISTDNLGMNYGYPSGDYRTRERIIAEHRSYQQGLHWTLANHPRVPQAVRQHFQTWGLAKDEFVDTGHWPHQLYVREARRMISDYVMTQHNCQGRQLVDDPVGLAAYTMDSHNVQRFVRDGRVWNEGDVQVGGFSPYPIAYRSIRPKKTECVNLLVPVCIAASHIAYGSIRMEPVFMVLGQSAALAACQSIDEGVSVQKVDVDALLSSLRSVGQVLEWSGPKRKPPVEPSTLPGIVLDDRQGEFSGEWGGSAAVEDYIGYGYRHDGNTGKGTATARFRPSIDKPGRYRVGIAYTKNPNRASNVPVTVVHAGGRTVRKIDQRKQPRMGRFYPLGEFRFDAGDAGFVLVETTDTDGYVVVDAVQFLRLNEASEN